YAALLVSMHGTALYERWPPEDPDDKRLVQAFLDEQHALQSKLAEGLDTDQVRRNQRLIFAWDYISLALCLDWAPAEVKDVPTAREPVTLADAIREVKETVTQCEVCFNLAVGARCRICEDERRDPALICVVEEPSDVIPIERTNEFHGRYHVLGGALSPIDGIDPED